MVYRVTGIANIRVKPPNQIPQENQAKTFEALAKWEEKREEMDARLFPPGFLELQGRFNQF